VTPAQPAWIETRDVDDVAARPAPASPNGRIHVVTDVPIEIDDRPVARAWAAVSRRPWLPPALILGLVASYLLLRSR
jgi:hypothetical protein